MSHPLQDIYIDESGYPRFRENKIVRMLLDKGPFGINQLVQMEFSQDDIEQFFQIIGYSIGGFSELSFVSDETYERAEAEAKKLSHPIDSGSERGD